MIRTPALLLAAACTGGLCAQGDPSDLLLAPGFAAEVLYQADAFSFGFAGFATGEDPRELFLAAGDRFLHRTPDGEITVLDQLDPGGMYGSLLRPEGRRELLLTRFGSSTLTRLRFDLSQIATVDIPRNTFSLAVGPEGELLTASNPDWPAPGSGTSIFRMKRDGSFESILSVGGPSGPITVRGDGALYYATQPNVFPAPPGSVTIGRFRSFVDDRRSKDDNPKADRYRGAIPFETLISGLGGAYDLSFDDRGRLFWSHPLNGLVERTRPGRSAREEVPLVTPDFRSPHGITHLEFRHAAGGSDLFEAYQPDRGAALYVAQDVGGRALVHRIFPRRPRILRDGDGSAVVVDMPPFQPVLLLGSVALPLQDEWNLPQADGLRLWWGLDPATTVVLAEARGDGSGRVRFDLELPTGLGAVGLQALSFAPISESGLVPVSSEPTLWSVR